jgi:hypothetical protein
LSAREGEEEKHGGSDEFADESYEVVLCVRTHPYHPGKTHHVFGGGRAARRVAAIVVPAASADRWAPGFVIVVLVVTAVM